MGLRLIDQFLICMCIHGNNFFMQVKRLNWNREMMGRLASVMSPQRNKVLLKRSRYILNRLQLARNDLPPCPCGNLCTSIWIVKHKFEHHFRMWCTPQRRNHGLFLALTTGFSRCWQNVSILFHSIRHGIPDTFCYLTFGFSLIYGMSIKILHSN